MAKVAASGRGLSATTGISATDEEKEAAHKKAIEIYNFLEGYGWHQPMVADSGNGFHLLYRINQRCDDDGLIEKVIARLGDRFDGEGVKLDRTVFNPARIVRLYGTLAAKGDDTQERPHRTSKILKAPLLCLVREEQLQALVQNTNLLKSPDNAVDPKHGAFDVEHFLSRHRVEAEKTTEPDGTIKWTLAQCPFNADHRAQMRQCFSIQTAGWASIVFTTLASISSGKIFVGILNLRRLAKKGVVTVNGRQTFLRFLRAPWIIPRRLMKQPTTV